MCLLSPNMVLVNFHDLVIEVESGLRSILIHSIRVTITIVVFSDIGPPYYFIHAQMPSLVVLGH